MSIGRFILIGIGIFRDNNILKLLDGYGHNDYLCGRALVGV
jgi:hypothetical protein